MNASHANATINCKREKMYTTTYGHKQSKDKGIQRKVKHLRLIGIDVIEITKSNDNNICNHITGALKHLNRLLTPEFLVFEVNNS